MDSRRPEAARQRLRPRGLGVLPLVAVIYFIVAGGPYGLEELVSSVGYKGAVLALVTTPLVWSLPTALMVGELASAVPEEGGYYAWVRRAMGPFWGFQEAWLSLSASVFDMAIYPTLFTLYLARVWPTAGEGVAPIAVGTAMMAVCAVWNIGGSRRVAGASIALTAFLLAPFAILSVAALARALPPPPGSSTMQRGPHGILTALLIAMWNYMGWDNASTIGREVDKPERTYPIAMCIAVALVALTYLLPVWAVSIAGMDASSWRPGAWVDVADTLVGRWLAWVVVAGGMACGAGMFNALLMSYSRLPAVLAADGYLPAFLATRHPRSGAPWMSIALCCAVYAGCLVLGFRRLVELDVLLYGISLALEFAALVVLRIREPLLLRPFRIPGGLAGAIAIGVPPTGLVAIAIVKGAAEDGGRALALGGALLALGPLLYLVRRRNGRPKSQPDERVG